MKNNYCTKEVDVEDLENSLIKCPVSTSNSNHTYAIGDTIEFAGSNWKVIKASTTEEDYVTVMKELVLTNAELGNYASNSTDHAMEYTWTDSCHNAAHGYSDIAYNCDNKNSYATSKVKEMLETKYLPTIGGFNLKEVDGYKIRLVTLDELYNNLGCISSNRDCTSSPYASWLHEYFGNDAYGYWTMTGDSNFSINTWYLYFGGQTNTATVMNYTISIRPVINLLKFSIH